MSNTNTGTALTKAPEKQLNGPTPATLLEIAVEKGVDIAQLKELMDLQERWERNQAKKSFLAALSKFQTIVPDLKKNKVANIASTKGSYSYKYSDLGAIAKAIKEPLNECGLSYRWEFAEANDKMRVTCLVSHCDGHTESTSMESYKDDSGAKNAIQSKGSAHTYLQRYTLIGALGLSTADEDNDGKGAKPSQKKTELDPAEIREQWTAAVTSTKSKIELQQLYLKNKKTVDAEPWLQKMFKDQQEQLKNTSPQKTVLP